MSREREACVWHKRGLRTFLSFLYKPSFPGKKPTVPDQGPEVKRRLQSGVGGAVGGGVGVGGATFLKADGGIKALQIHFAWVSLASAYSKQFSHSFRGCKAAKNRRKRRIRDSKAWFGKGLLFAGEIREKNYRVPVQKERRRGQEGVGTDVRNIQESGLRIVYLNIKEIWFFWWFLRPWWQRYNWHYVKNNHGKNLLL